MRFGTKITFGKKENGSIYQLTDLYSLTLTPPFPSLYDYFCEKSCHLLVMMCKFLIVFGKKYKTLYLWSALNQNYEGI